MDKLQAHSALATGYKPGEFGLVSDAPLKLVEKRGRSMYSLVVFDSQGVNKHMQDRHGPGLPGTGESSRQDKTSILWTRPERYLVIRTGESSLDDIASGLTDENGMLQDLSSARTIIRLQGANARKVLAKGLTVEVEENAFASGRVILSSFDHHFPAIIHNVSLDETAFEIYITRSFALSFWQWLCDASLEYGYCAEEEAGA